ncbi:hypothetical protein [Edaphobacter aggregans]|uniref:hypothetical protein n=1 Tax=Edaphobacter aggregans TaxID=570835 RepID=UPI0005558A7E|nr:hypothetical protein [Edaphobacter aggregans]
MAAPYAGAFPGSWVAMVPRPRLIRGSGIPFIMLRNGWYIENYMERLDIPLVDSLALQGMGESLRPRAKTTPLRQSLSSLLMDTKAKPTK